MNKRFPEQVWQENIRRLLSKAFITEPQELAAYLKLPINRVIAILGADPRFALDEVGKCFNLSRERVRLIVIQQGLTVTRKNAHAYLELLTQEEVERVMQRAAREKAFWKHNTLDPLLILQALHSRRYGKRYACEIWRGIVRKFQLDTRLPGVIIKYGLGEDPKEFLEKLHIRQGLSFPKLTEYLNQQARNAGLLTIRSWGTIALYMHDRNFQVHPKGRRSRRS